MTLSRFVSIMVLHLVLAVPSSVLAGNEERLEEFNELKQAYDAAVAQSGKMSETANEVREELIGHFFDFKPFGCMRIKECLLVLKEQSGHPGRGNRRGWWRGTDPERKGTQKVAGRGRSGLRCEDRGKRARFPAASDR